VIPSDCLRILLLAIFWSVMFSGCGSTNRSAPVEDRTRGSIDTPPVESRTQSKPAAKPEPQSVPEKADSGASAKTVAASGNEEARPQTQESVSSGQRSAPQAQTLPATQATDEGDWRPEFYTVRKGDTLYSIALNFGQDYRDVAAWNNLANASYIQIGQRLRVSAPRGANNTTAGGPLVLPPASLPGSGETPAKSTAVPTFDDPLAYRAVYSQQAYNDLQRHLNGEVQTTVVDPKSEPAPAATARAKPAASKQPATTAKPVPAKSATSDGRLSWEWPATGDLLYGFNKGPMKKGVAIQGQPGQSVVSSAPGKVVYSGSGLRGYGNLIIVKHNATYLSVYAHNRQLLVSEGQMVAQGQKIGVMGEISPGKTALHFEIRKLGKPINPLDFLPEKAS